MKILALDIGGSKLMAAAVTFSPEHTNENIVQENVVRRSLGTHYSTDTLLTLIDEVINEITTGLLTTGLETEQSAFSFEKFPFEKIGITIPGLADAKTGTWVYASYSGIRNFPIGTILSSKYGCPVFIDNDVNACAIGEKRFGKCREVDNYLWMTVSNGVGGGLVLNGVPYNGFFGNAAEIGHFCVVEKDSVIPSDFRCGCGNIGCLESEAAGPGIARRFRYLLEKNGRNREWNPSITARDVAEKAEQGDVIAREVIDTTGRLIGKALSYVVNLLNLQMVVLGGGVMESFDMFYPSMEQSFLANIFRDANPAVQIEKSALGYNAALVGAAALTVR